MATVDGFNPFGNPFENAGKYDPCTDGVGFAKGAGGVSREVALLATGTKGYQMLGKGILKSSGITGASGIKQGLVGRAGMNAMFGRQAFVEAFGGQALGNAMHAVFAGGNTFLAGSFGIDTINRWSEIYDSFFTESDNCY